MRFLFLALLVVGETVAFCPKQAPFASRPSLLLFAKKKKNKLSFAEKQRRRANKQQQKVEVPSTPSNVDFSSVSSQQTDASIETDVPDQYPEKQLAKQIIDAQRQSVDMLTHVRERVEALPFEDINNELETKGYSVINDFLQEDSVIDQLLQEGAFLQQDDLMELDVEHGIGSGEYVANIKGGEEQYQHCPRSIEYVVSVTKHLPSKVQINEKLDSTASLGTMRTYSRKARLASVALLTGKDDDDLSTAERPFGLVVDGDSDARKVTLLYYPISPEWDDSCGGGVTLQDKETPDKVEVVGAKRDRLVFLKSDTCVHRTEPYKGRDGLETASCIELHLVETSQ